MDGMSIMVFAMAVCTRVPIVWLVQLTVWSVFRVYSYGTMSALMYALGDTTATMAHAPSANILALNAVMAVVRSAMMGISLRGVNADLRVRYITMRMR